jgi:hypothetical protein
MGALTAAISSAMTRRHAPESGNTGLATQVMGTSVKALDIVAKGNKEGAQALTLATNTIAKNRSTQAATSEVAKKAGQLKGWADQQEALKPMINAMAKDFERGSKAQTDMAKTIAKTTQNVGVLNAEAQYEMFKGHSAASTKIAVAQSAYGGAGWSA